MAVLKQLENAYATYHVWYGDCEFENLPTINIGNYSAEIYDVVQYTESGGNSMSFLSSYYPMMDFLNPLKVFTPGLFYSIRLKKGNNEIDIPGMVQSYFDSEPLGDITKVCGGGGVSFDFARLTEEMKALPSSKRKDESFIGRIVKVELEGGFYGVEVDSEVSIMSTGSNTKKYLPVNIQTELTGNEGFYLKLTDGYTQDGVSIFMWGSLLYAENFEIVTATPTPTPTPTLTPTPTPTPTQTPTPNVPVYELESVSSVDEGEILSIKLKTTYVPTRTEVYYTLTNGLEVGVSNPSGKFTIGPDGTSTNNFLVTADQETEGEEVLSLELTGSSIGGDEWQNVKVDVTINDTSTKPTPTPAIENDCCEPGFKTFLVEDGLVNQSYTYTEAGRPPVVTFKWNIKHEGKLCVDANPVDTAIVNTLQSSQKLYLSDDTDQVGVFTKLILNTEDRVYFTKTTGECYMGIWNPNDDKITLDLISSDKTPTPTPDISIPGPITTPTPTPTLTPDIIVPVTCCSGGSHQIIMVNGEPNQPSVNQLSLNSNIDGTLCWEHDITPGAMDFPRMVALMKDGVKQGSLAITISGTSAPGAIFKFETLTDCYVGEIASFTEENIFNKVN